MITKDNIEDLIKFGGLLVYEVKILDPLGFKIVTELRTFNEDYAVTKLKSLEDGGYQVRLVSYMVHFNYDKTY